MPAPLLYKLERMAGAIAIALLPGGLFYLTWKLASRCRHRVELAHRLPDGSMGLACAGCGRVRQHPWGAAWAGPAPETGIERARREGAALAREAKVMPIRSVKAGGSR